MSIYQWLQSCPSGKPHFKGQGSVNLTVVCCFYYFKKKVETYELSYG